jgi:hypothetical protein
MKTQYQLTLALIILTSLSFAQKIEYAYSPSGNRTMRKFNISAFRVAKKDSVESAKEFPKILMQEGLSVFPNPTSDKVVLTINDFKPEENNSMSLIDVKGNVVMTQKITEARSEMDVSKLVSGIYYFNVVKNKNMLYYKLIKVD